MIGDDPYQADGTRILFDPSQTNEARIARLEIRIRSLEIGSVIFGALFGIVGCLLLYLVAK